MKIKTDINLYFSGSGLTEDRCNDFVKLYEIAESVFSDSYTYKDLQEASFKNAGPGESAVRTLIPLFKLMGFVEYSKSSTFNFTDDGRIFYYMQKSISEAVKATFPQKESVIRNLEEATTKLYWKGFMRLLDSDDDNGRKFRIAYSLFSHFHEINWNEYLYSLILVLGEEQQDVQEAISRIEVNRSNNVTYEIQAKGKNGQYDFVASTATSYMKSILETAGLIENAEKSNTSRITNRFHKFQEYVNC